MIFGAVLMATSKFWSSFDGKTGLTYRPPFGKLEKSIGKLKIFCGKLGSWGCNSGYPVAV